MFEKLAGIELCNQATTKLKLRNELDTTESLLTQSLINFKSFERAKLPLGMDVNTTVTGN